MKPWLLAALLVQQSLMLVLLIVLSGWIGTDQQHDEPEPFCERYQYAALQ